MDELKVVDDVVEEKNINNPISTLTENVENSNPDNASTDVPNLEQNQEQSNVVNCLSLTVKKDYNLSIVKNVVIKTIKNSLRVSFTVFILNILKLFS
jgi:hypothetical protein